MKFRTKPTDRTMAEIVREIEDKYISIDENGDIVIDRDIHCRSIYVEGESLYIGGIKVTRPRDNDANAFWKYDPARKSMVFTKNVIEGSAGHVSNVTGTLADLVEQFNDLKSKLEELGIIEKV